MRRKSRAFKEIMQVKKQVYSFAGLLVHTLWSFKIVFRSEQLRIRMTSRFSRLIIIVFKLSLFNYFLNGFFKPQ